MTYVPTRGPAVVRARSHRRHGTRRSTLVTLAALVALGAMPLVALGPVSPARAQEALDPFDADGDGIPDAVEPLLDADDDGQLDDPGPPDRTRTVCALDPATGTLAVVMLQAAEPNATDALTITRGPGPSGTITVAATGLAPGTPPDCGGARVDTVDTVVVRATGLGGLSVTLDQGEGRFAPGVDHGEGAYRDVFAPGGEEPDARPEIEFDVRHTVRQSRPATRPFFGLPVFVDINQLATTELTVIGSEGGDAVVLGSPPCDADNLTHTGEADPRCRLLAANLHAADEDADADLFLARGERHESGYFTTAEVDRVSIVGRAGDDVLTARGGTGTGGPLRAARTRTNILVGENQLREPPGVVLLALDGGDGDDMLAGGEGRDLLVGGAGDDHLVDSSGDDTVLADCAPPDDASPACSGDDVLDQGQVPNGADVLRGGPGEDQLDYSARPRTVTVTKGQGDDDGEEDEHDDVGADVETVLLPDVATPDDRGPGLRVVGRLPAPHKEGCTARSEGFSSASDPCPNELRVDSIRSLGIAHGREWGEEVFEGSGESGLVLYDLRTARWRDALSDEVLDANEIGTAALGSASYAVDTRRGVIWVPFVGVSGVTVAPDAPSCSESTSTDATRVGAVSYVDASGAPGLAAWRPERQPTMPCSKTGYTLLPLSMSYDADRDKLYVVGTWLEAPGVRNVRHNNFFQTENYNGNLGEPLVVRQLSIVDDPVTGGTSFELDWDLDLLHAGCGRRASRRLYTDRLTPLFVGRIGDEIVTYCWDARPYSATVLGNQGYVVQVPLDEHDHPRTVSPTDEPAPAVPDPHGSLANYRYERVPALAGNPYPIADPDARLLYLATSDRTNGNAVWVYDPRQHRLVGVATAGVIDQPEQNQEVGFDARRGRVYVLSKEGILAVPARTRPLPGGQLHRVARNGDGIVEFNGLVATMGVAPRLGRLFLPIHVPFGEAEAQHYLVVEDTTPDPPAAKPFDPDASTLQVDERPGVTESRSAGAVEASGAHVVVVGGIPRLVNQADPLCVPVDASVQGGTVNALAGTEQAVTSNLVGSPECLASLVVSPGHRELFAAEVSADAGTETGASARASGGGFPASDQATPSDVRKGTDCGAGLLQHLAGSTEGDDPFAPYAEGCQRAQDTVTGQGRDEEGDPVPPEEGDPRALVPDRRTGTGGRDGRGFPVPATECADFGGSPVTEAESGSSLVSCDGAAVAATAYASSSSIALPTAEDPLVTVESTSSWARSFLGPEGHVSMAVSRARGVRVGPLAVGEVRSVAVARAKGRSGTARAELFRQWCGVEVVPGEEGVPPADVEYWRSRGEGCLDPTEPRHAQALRRLNQSLGPVRLTVPSEERTATPGGYQAVVTRDPDQQAGDRALNFDETHTAPGLQVVLYNDGADGRSRLVVQLAGVHTESRYGITLLPRFSFPEGFDGFGGGTPGAPGTPGTPGITRFLPGSVPEASAIVEGEVFEYIIEGGGLAGLRDDLPTDPIRRFLRWLPDAARDLLRLFIQHPIEFALLFLVFSLLGAPAYMAYRRRTFVGVVAG